MTQRGTADFETTGTISMTVDVPGRIRNVNIATKHGLLPLFEAVVNSIHAIQDEYGIQAPELGEITVVLNRVRDPVLTGISGRVPAARIWSITVEDNGSGFNDRNWGSFLTADSPAKLDRGGKGIGRFTWLKVFEEARVRSVFRDGAEFRERVFRFVPRPTAIENLRESTPSLEKAKLRTEIELYGVLPRFHVALRKSLDHVVARLFEHCFPYLVLGGCPSIKVCERTGDGAPSECVLLSSRLADLTLNDTESIQIGDHTLQVRHVQQKGYGLKHKAHLCGNNRVVKSLSLAEISELTPEPLVLASGPAVHQVFVTGPALDESVDSSRTGFDFATDDDDDDPDLLSTSNELHMRNLKLAIGDVVNNKLADLLAAESARNLELIRKHIKTVQPEYGSLMQRAPHLLRKIRYVENTEQMDVELYKASQALEVEARRRQSRTLARIQAGEDVEQVVEELQVVAADALASGQTNLMRYVIKRRTTLEILSGLISSYGGQAMEKEVHSLVFPMKTDNDSVGLFDHNLWLLDDALAFYEFVASDQAFSEIDVAPASSRRRPDILAFKTGDPFQHVALIELKRPDRNDNPVTQLVDQAGLLRDGGKKDIKGRTMPKLPLSVRIDGFAVCTLSEKLTKAMRRGPGEMKEAEGQARWYGAVADLNLTIEVLDYSAFFRRAVQRNHPFFVQLNLPPMS